MTCPLCQADPCPPYFGEPRRCAFGFDGLFRRSNWNCATMNRLRDMCNWGNRDDNSAGSIGIIQLPDTGEELRGYLILTWHKDRGCTGGARIVCDDEPDQALTLEIAERLISI